MVVVQVLSMPNPGETKPGCRPEVEGRPAATIGLDGGGRALPDARLEHLPARTFSKPHAGQARQQREQKR